MPGGDEILGLKTAAYGVGAALMFQAAGTNVYDAFSAVMSSPWSTEKFTNDPEEERMAREYVTHALVISGSYAAISAGLAYKSGGMGLAVWPIIGAIGVAGYMYWLYSRALARSQSAGGMTATTEGAGY
jgi:predicted membrane metal-binding protein